MLNDPIFKLLIAAVVTSLIGYLINQLPSVKQFPARNWLVGGLLFCVTLLGLGVQVLPDPSVSEEIKTWVRYGSIVLGTLLVVGVVGLFWAGRSRGSEAQDLRLRLLKQLQFEVNERLKDSLTNWVLIPVTHREDSTWIVPTCGALADTMGSALDYEASPVEEPQSWLRALNPLRWLKRKGRDTIELEPQETMLEVFERVNRKLLILGEPGSGKTIALLTLAKELIQAAIDDSTQPIPVIFELSNWKQDSQSIAAWLVEELSDRIKQKTAKQWLEAGQVLPLLDGLDELGERQKKGAEALNCYVQGNLGADLVVCCRNEEYLQAGVVLEQLNSAVCLQPLSDQQIEDYFGQVQQPQIWQRIQQEPGLRQLLDPDANGKTGMLRIPLFLKMLLEVEPQENRPIHNRRELLDAYVDYRLDLRVIKAEHGQRKRWAFSAGQEPKSAVTRRYLIWLSKQLVSNKQTEFLIEKMQPTLLESLVEQWQYRLIYGLIYGLIGGLVLGLVGGLILGLIGGLIGGLILGLTLGLDTIEPIEGFKFSMRRLLQQRNLRSLRQRLMVGLIIGLIVGLIAAKVLTDYFLSDTMLIVGLVLGLMVGLIAGLIYGLKDELKTCVRPNQGIWLSAKNVLLTTALSYFPSIAIVLSGIVVPREKVGESPFFTSLSLEVLFSALGWALVFGYLFGGGLSCTQHFSLRFTLWSRRRIPWNYARFLRYTAERRLIQQIGGRYRFLHRELLEHFAQMPHP